MATFTVSMTCLARGPYTEGAATLRRYFLTATACNQPAGGTCPNPAPGADYVERQVSAEVER
jgi:MSHA biogenesis protein MshP